MLISPAVAIASDSTDPVVGAVQRGLTFLEKDCKTEQCTTARDTHSSDVVVEAFAAVGMLMNELRCG